MNDNTITYNVIQKEKGEAIGEQIIASGTYDECKDFLVAEYGDMPVHVFLMLDIMIEAVQS